MKKFLVASAMVFLHSNTIIAAGAVVLEGTVCEGGAIYAGVPAKKVKDISPEKVEGEINSVGETIQQEKCGGLELWLR